VVLGTTAAVLVLLGLLAAAGGNPGVEAAQPEVATSSPAPVSAPATSSAPATTSAPPEPVEAPALAEPTPGPQAATPDDDDGVTTAEGSSAEPLRVRIPGIEVDAPIIDLGLNEDGTLEVPSDFDDTGWYTGRSVPGEVGPSVVVGHVDSTKGPAVFYRLRDLVVGDRIQVDRTDGTVAWFEVTETVLVDKDEFPTEDVYGGTEEPTLRLITCGGSFDRDARSYRGNVIVYAEHVGNYEPPPGDEAT